jgi:isocitrate dehydrogenase kinase/phosphatase
MKNSFRNLPLITTKFRIAISHFRYYQKIFTHQINFKKFILNYEQHFDLEGLIGRIISSSYMPNQDHPNFPQLKNAIVSLFDKYKQNEIVTFAYNTIICTLESNKTL